MDHTATTTATTRRRLVALGATVLIALAAVVWFVFEPQTLFFDTTVDEQFPAVSGLDPDAAADPMADATDDAMGEEMGAQAGEEMAADEPIALVAGTFVDRSHPTTGTATVYELGDGSQVLRLEDFETDNGPDLRVYLSTASVDAEAGDFDEDAVDLGVLKGNIGNQNYELPADVDLSRYTTVVIWCDRFDVAFGAAALSAG